MIQYVYCCPNGHSQGVFSDRAEAERARRELGKCDRCGRRRKLVGNVVNLGAAIFDIPEHFNYSFGERVKSRRHFRKLQEKHRTQDWIPVKDSPSTEKLRREGRI